MGQHLPIPPLLRYEQDLEKPGFVEDAAQRMAVEALQDLYEKLIAPREEAKGFGHRLRRRFKPAKMQSIKGLYMWGGVGRGKTYLMDCFYESLPFPQKMRLHFHRFMQRTHQELGRMKGYANPLVEIARTYAREARVICFDEFFVSDIGDAMILAGLLDELFAQGVVLVCTSNITPDRLYENGLQRARFLPAIQLVQEYTNVLNVDNGQDYRLRTLQQAELFYAPLDEGSERALANAFESLALDLGDDEVSLTVNERPMQTVRHAEDVVWFEFSTLCDEPRSQNDYIELARQFHAVLVANVPQMGIDREDQARRFINLVDEFYDRKVKLIVSAEVSIDQLYSGHRLKFEFERTGSRLLEMQSEEYLKQPHLA